MLFEWIKTLKTWRGREAKLRLKSMWFFASILFLFQEWNLRLLFYNVTAKNTVISPDFPVWKFCGKAQFLHSCRRFARNYAETVPFHKISTPGNKVKLRYFLQRVLQIIWKKTISLYFLSCLNKFLQRKVNHADILVKLG